MINDHLGDAYWRVGRRREAEWMWKRVLVLDPDAERRAEEVLDGLGLAEIDRGTPLGEISGGQQQRLSIALALVKRSTDPQAVLLAGTVSAAQTVVVAP